MILTTPVLSSPVTNTKKKWTYRIHNTYRKMICSFFTSSEWEREREIEWIPFHFLRFFSFKYCVRKENLKYLDVKFTPSPSFLSCGISFNHLHILSSFNPWMNHFMNPFSFDSFYSRIVSFLTRFPSQIHQTDSSSLKPFLSSLNLFSTSSVLHSVSLPGFQSLSIIELVLFDASKLS